MCTIDPTSIQTNQSRKTRTRAPHRSQTLPTHSYKGFISKYSHVVGFVFINLTKYHTTLSIDCVCIYCHSIRVHVKPKSLLAMWDIQGKSVYHFTTVPVPCKLYTQLYIVGGVAAGSQTRIFPCLLSHLINHCARLSDDSDPDEVSSCETLWCEGKQFTVHSCRAPLWTQRLRPVTNEVTFHLLL